MSENQPSHTPNRKRPSNASTNSLLIRQAKQLLADIQAREQAQNKATPTVWAYEQDGSMNPPIVTVDRWARIPQDWNETNLSRTLADPANGPTPDNLHRWAASMNKAAGQATDQAQSIELHTVAQEVENAAVFAQARELLQSDDLNSELAPQQTHGLHDNIKLLTEAQDLFVLQDSRSSVGNQILFHAQDMKGYTTNISKAHLFTEAEAKRLSAARTTDKAYRVGYLLQAASIGVDSEALTALNGTNTSGVNSAHTMFAGPSANKSNPPRRTITENALKEELEQSADSHPKVVVIYRYGQPDLPEAILIDPEPFQIDQHTTSGDRLVVDEMTLADFGSQLWRYPNLHEAMTYSHWVTVSELIKPHLHSVFLDDPTPNEIGPKNPIDLPPILAQARLALQNAFPRPETLQSKLELTEIVMANLYGEPVNNNIFSEKSLSMTPWREPDPQECIGDLMGTGADINHDIKTLKAQFARETDAGQTISSEDRLELALLEQEASELALRVDMAQLRLERSSRLGQNNHAQALYEDEPDYDDGPGL